MFVWWFCTLSCGSCRLQRTSVFYNHTIIILISPHTEHDVKQLALIPNIQVAHSLSKAIILDSIFRFYWLQTVMNIMIFKYLSTDIMVSCLDYWKLNSQSSWFVYLTPIPISSTTTTISEGGTHYCDLDNADQCWSTRQLEYASFAEALQTWIRAVWNLHGNLSGLKRKENYNKGEIGIFLLVNSPKLQIMFRCSTSVGQVISMVRKKEKICICRHRGQRCYQNKTGSHQNRAKEMQQIWQWNPNTKRRKKKEKNVSTQKNT